MEQMDMWRWCQSFEEKISEEMDRMRRSIQCCWGAWFYPFIPHHTFSTFLKTIPSRACPKSEKMLLVETFSELAKLSSHVSHVLFQLYIHTLIRRLTFSTERNACIDVRWYLGCYIGALLSARVCFGIFFFFFYRLENPAGMVIPGRWVVGNLEKIYAHCDDITACSRFIIS